MKNYSKIVLTGLSLFVLASCADDNLVDFKTPKPEELYQDDKLNEYTPLKTYVDRTAYSNFKMGVMTGGSDFNKKGALYSLVCSNFDEMTPGNEMKHRWCVRDDGAMDFSVVKDFVNIARSAGVSVYGHTLCWHQSTNTTYLNSLIADKELPDLPPEEVDVVVSEADYTTLDKFPYYGADPSWKGTVQFQTPDGVKFHNEEPATNYHLQYQPLGGFTAVADNTYKIILEMKANANGFVRIRLGDFGKYDVKDVNFSASSDFQTLEVELKAPLENCFVLFQHGSYVGDLWIKTVKVTHKEMQVSSLKKYVLNYDFENGDKGSWGNIDPGVTPLPITIESMDGKKVMRVLKDAEPTGSDFSAQFSHKLPTPLVKGKEYIMEMKVKATANSSFRIKFQPDDGSGATGANITGIPLTTEWKTLKYKITPSCDGVNVPLFCLGKSASSTIYFDEIYLYSEEKANTRPLDPEEKKRILNSELDRWIGGMMAACDGYVKAWDVINEAIDANDSHKIPGGFYGLRSEEYGDPKNDFYWADHMGENYVRDVVRLAREHGPEDLKVFINDFNLEATYDNNLKCKSLIHWIEQWESDGVTKIDGIGTQMHISYQMDPAKQKQAEDAVVNMLRLLTGTGKLVKISELDMGIRDENGKDILTEDVTPEMHQRMADYYEFIVKSYLEIIPAEQQYGITQGGVQDAPVTGSWRPGLPIGLWNKDGKRKPAYAGFAKGLMGGKQ